MQNDTEAISSENFFPCSTIITCPQQPLRLTFGISTDLNQLAKLQVAFQQDGTIGIYL